ncbi:MAG: Na+/H+ antiporter subunit D [Deltaproteobacteria bacterium]|nr:Na+/H+ antiporter subunit D [Deltaproteobacteria bacterium]
MKIQLILPLLIPLTTAILSLLAWNWSTGRRAISVAGAFLLLADAAWLLATVWDDGIQVMAMGNWPAPFGIVFVADLFSAMMVVIAGVMGFAVAIYSLVTMDRGRESFGYYALLHFLLLGVCGAFLTGDLFNLYVWFEVMLMASFVLLALGGERPQMEGAIKYVTLNLISSALFLAAVGLLYGVAGTLNMADLAQKLRAPDDANLVTTIAMLFLVAFGIKAGIFPLFFWLPASYHTPPVAVSAIFAALLTKVGVYALIRVFTLLFVQDIGYTHTVILILAGLTMVTGVLGAIAQNEFRRILAFHIISQIGYMIMGLGIFTQAALAGSIFYTLHHIIVKTNLFLVSGVAHFVHGTYDLKKLGGLYKNFPGLSFLFLIPALSLAGVPPLSGFFGKLTLAQAGIASEQYVIVATALAVGLLTLFSMTKIWLEAFWKAPPQLPTEACDAKALGSRAAYYLLLSPIILLALLTLIFGFAAEAILVVSLRAAEQLMNPAEYIRAVLGKTS